MSILKNINDTNYNESVMQTEKPFVLIFTSKKCVHCKSVEKFFENISSQYRWADIFFIDGDNSPKLLNKFGIRSFPTTHFFGRDKNGVKRVVGAVAPDDFFSGFEMISPNKKSGFFEKLFKGKKE